MLLCGARFITALAVVFGLITSTPAQETIVENSELAANPDVAPPEHIKDWADVKRDPIDVERAGKLLPSAIALMQKVGWK